MNRYNTLLDFTELHKHINVVGHREMEAGRLIGIHGPARSGISALFFLFANLDTIQRMYYQPLTTLQRLGGPDITINLRNITCIKEVFWSLSEKWRYDPIDILVRSGVPKEFQQHIFMVRDPIATFNSWRIIEPDITPEIFIYWFTTVIDLYEKKRDLGYSVLPLTYEIFEENELFFINKLLNKLEIDERFTELTLPNVLNTQKVSLGQAKDEEYFKKILQNIFEEKYFKYKRSGPNLFLREAEKIEKSCTDLYLRMAQDTRDKLLLT